jgi:hypothetical protein
LLGKYGVLHKTNKYYDTHPMILKANYERINYYSTTSMRHKEGLNPHQKTAFWNQLITTKIAVLGGGSQYEWKLWWKWLLRSWI